MARQFAFANTQSLVLLTGAPVNALPVTFHVRVTFDAFTTNPWLICLGSDAPLWLGVSPLANGGMRAIHYDGSSQGIATNATNVTTGSNYSAVGLFESTTSRSICLNGPGNKVTDTTSVAGSMAGLNRMALGAFIGGAQSNYLDGSLSDVAIWNVVLTDDEIRALALGIAARCIRPSALVAYWPLLDPAAPDVDRWRNRYDLTPIGAPTMATHPRLYLPQWHPTTLPPPPPVITLAGSATIPLASTAALLTTARLAAVATVALATAATLSVSGPLLAQAAVEVSSAASLTTAPRLFAATTLAVSTRASFAVALETPAAEMHIGATATISPSPRATTPVFELGGVDVTARVRKAGVSIRDVLNDAPNTASLVFEGTAVPQVGLPLRITLNDGAVVLFSGTLQSVDRSYEGGKPALLHWPCTAIDDTQAANRRRPFGTWVNVSASSVATEIAAAFAPPDFTTQIAPDLPAVTITFDGSETMIGALVRLANLVGGYAKMENRTIHLFIEDLTDLPDPIDVSHPPLNDPPIAMTVDASQLRTRVYGKGYGENVLADVAAGETLLPIPDGAQFTALGGQAIAGTTADSAQSQVISYAGVVQPTGGSLVGPGAAPANAPTLGLATGGVVTNGVHQAGAVHVTAVGKSLLGPVGAINVNPIAAPASAPIASAAQNGTGPDQGQHDYVVTNLMLGGETTPGPVSNAITTSAASGQVSEPGAPSVGTPVDGSGVTVGTHDYVQTFVTAQGETTPSTPSAQVYNGNIVGGVNPPSAPSVSAPQIGAGVDTGAHTYAVTFVTADGETTLGSASGSVSTIENGGELPGAGAASDAPLSPLTPGVLNDFTTYYYKVTFVTAIGETHGTHPGTDGAVGPGWPIKPGNFGGYGPSTGGSLTAAGQYVYHLTYVTASGLETDMGDSMTVQLFGSENAVQFNALPTSGDGRVVTRNLYRTKANPGSPANRSGYLVATINDNSSVSYKDTMADSAINTGTIYWENGWGSPSGPRGTGPGWQARVFNIPTGPAGTTGRKLYRSTVFAGTFRLIATLNDNSTTQFIDNVPVASEGAVLPTTNTTGQPAHQIPVANIPTGGGGTGVTARRLYRDSAGQGWRLVDTIANNSATQYTDTKPNSQLGANPPATNTTGRAAQDLPVSIYIGPAGVTKRRLFRRFNTSGPFKLVAAINDNSTTSYLDTKSNAALGEDAPTSNTTGIAVQRIPVSAIPLGPAGTTGRNLYRRFNLSGAFQLVATLANNTATTHSDSTPNSGLGAVAPTVNTATGNTIELSNIPTGSTAVTAREIYMSLAGQSVLRLALIIANNTDRTGTLNLSDASLAGQPTPPITDTSGLSQPQGQVSPGATQLIVASPAPFFVTGGWVITGGGQVLRYTGISGQLLIGIPATGPGAIVTTILYGQQATPAPMLIGVSGLGKPMARGAAVHIWVQRDDLAAQAEQAARDGSDGIVEFALTDARRAEPSLIARCDADLALFARPIVAVTYATYDSKPHSGKRVTINLPSPPIAQVLIIQEVTITEIAAAASLPPKRTVTASSVRFSLEDTLRRLVAG